MALMAAGNPVGPQVASPCRGKTSRTYAERMQEILRNLHSTLRAMTVVQRERSFRQLFSQQQRLRLEAYIVSTLNVSKEVAKVSDCKQCSEMPNATPLKTIPTIPLPSTTGTEKRCKVPGLVVNPQCNGRYFRAQVAIGSLRLVSRSSRNLRSTLPFCQCLSLVKDRLEQVRTLPSKDFAETFVEVLHAGLETHGISADHAGLRLYISFRPSCSRRRVSRHYLVADEAELRMGLEHWQQMQPGNQQWKQIFMEDCRGRPRQLKRARAILEESERRQDELVARRAHALQQRAEKERQKVLRQELVKSRKPRRQPELSRPERAVRRLLRRWTVLESSLQRGANRSFRSAAALL